MASGLCSLHFCCLGLPLTTLVGCRLAQRASQLGRERDAEPLEGFAEHLHRALEDVFVAQVDPLLRRNDLSSHPAPCGWR